MSAAEKPHDHPEGAATPDVILGWLSAIFSPEHQIEVRSIGPGKKVSSKQFKADQMAEMIDHALKESERCEGVYFTLNPVIVGTTGTTNDSEIERRLLLLIDSDPEREAGALKAAKKSGGKDAKLSASDVEKAHAFRQSNDIRAYLKSQGWPDPIEADSGNGYHLLYPIDLPNDDAARDLVKAVLVALAHRFNTAEAKIDRVVYNASRITKLYGTVPRKGQATADRPHRASRVLNKPSNFWAQVVTPEQLQAVAEIPAVAGRLPLDPEPSKPIPFDGVAVNLKARDEWTPEARAIEYVGKCEGAVSGNNGHSQTFKVACKMVEFGLEPHEVLRILRQHYNPKCEPEWSEKELQHKVDEAFKKNGDRHGAKLREDRNGHQTATGKPEETTTEEDVSNPSVTKPRRQRFSNYHYEKSVDDEGKAVSKPAPNTVHEIDENLSRFAPGWPKRVQDSLFIGTIEHEPVYLSSSTRLFAWIDRQAQVDWTKGGRYVTQERFYEHKRMTSDRYEAIEVMPHTPSLPGMYYMHRDLPEPSGKLETFLDFFSPSSDIDRQLLKAMISTPSWGAHHGHRPGFMVTGPEKDPEQGRGLGKSTLVDVISDHIYGGYIDVSPTDDISGVKTRLLSDVSTIKRIVRLDNVKTLKFSWADLEGLMTASEISGHAMYKGEGRRPNTIVWMITLNGASLSKDMAQRVIPVKLKRPEFKAGWVEEVKRFASDHRWEILADIAAFLRRSPGPLKAVTRWASWERDVLSKLDQAEQCQREIIERQGTADDDNTDRDHVREYFAAQLTERGQDPEKSCIFIPALRAAEWLSEASRKNFETNKSSAHINGLGICELTASRDSRRRGFVWRGKESTARSPVTLADVEEENNRNFDQPSNPFAGNTPKKRR